MRITRVQEPHLRDRGYMKNMGAKDTNFIMKYAKYSPVTDDKLPEMPPTNESWWPKMKNRRLKSRLFELGYQDSNLE